MQEVYSKHILCEYILLEVKMGIRKERFTELTLYVSSLISIGSSNSFSKEAGSTSHVVKDFTSKSYTFVIMDKTLTWITFFPACILIGVIDPLKSKFTTLDVLLYAYTRVAFLMEAIKESCIYFKLFVEDWCLHNQGF